MEEITDRVDRTIANIREIHTRYKEEGVGKRDVMIFSHGMHAVTMAYSIEQDVRFADRLIAWTRPLL